MTTTVTRVDDIAPLRHDEAMRLAETEYERLVELAESLRPDDWSRPTDCPAWDVKAMLAHLLGMLKLSASPQEAARLFGHAAQVVAETGGLRIDAVTALQVRENGGLPTDELVAGIRALVPAALAGRRDTTDEQRAAPYPTDYPGEPAWTRGYLVDAILTRDPWMHRVDVCRATGHEMALTAEHDGRIVADVVADWARRHGRSFRLTLDGPAGGAFVAGTGGDEMRLDAVEFCRVLAGRGSGDGLLSTWVPF